MNPDLLLAAAILALLGMTSLFWCKDLGWLRGGMALILRLLWLIPLFACLFPRTRTEALPQSPSQKPVHILVDDSASMGTGTRSALAKVMTRVDQIRTSCETLNCAVVTTMLSSLSSSVASGFTPLSEVLETWFMTTGNDPWVLLSDGGDFYPTLDWPSTLKGAGANNRGVIASFAAHEEVNVILSEVVAPTFAFQDKPFQLKTRVTRTHKTSSIERVQVQALKDGRLLNSVNVEFRPEEDDIAVDLTVPPVERGQHLIEVKVLPVSDDRKLWDNQKYVQVEVMANTVGILHLLGSPTWDGRFMRRFLKSEPKFDLISFFILRDKWDSTPVSERELSLIPFPVNRLFQEELPNFRVVVVQNFALYEFLEPQYQENLVNYVQNGGSMLFIGGSRALQGGDVASSALSKILPFQKTGGGKSSGAQSSSSFFDVGMVNQDAPVYQADVKFKITAARPSDEQRALASVFDDYKDLAPDLAKLEHAQGLHKLDRVKFREGSYTPLLEARLEDGTKMPLAVASYPGKGRAIWIFSDALWRIALAPSEKISRQVYHQFVSSSLNWLMRDEVKKPLVVKDLRIRIKKDEGLQWRFDLRGPAVRYLQLSEWAMSVCGESVVADDILIETFSSEEVRLSGQIKQPPGLLKLCTAKVSAENRAFGQINAQTSEVLPKQFTDQEVGQSEQKLALLAELTGAIIVRANTMEEQIDKSLRNWFQDSAEIAPVKFRMNKDVYWIFDTWLFWILLLALPLEIITRRWHVLFGNG